jgi:hypothetical protein
MDDATKLNNLLKAIEEVELFPDGSVRIKWMANVSHEYPGHAINVADGSVILKGHQVHFNPELAQAITSIPFENVQNILDNGIEEAHKTVAKLPKLF